MEERKSILIRVAIGVFAVFIGFGIFAAIQVNREIIPNAQAVWTTADLLIQHLEAHQGAWPEGWHDLQAYTNRFQKGVTWTNYAGVPATEFRPRPALADLERRVEVNWNAKPDDLARIASQTSNQPPFRVVWLRNGKSTHYRNKEPNRMLADYLQWRSSQKQPAAAVGN